jgi:hypothetical protein
VSRFVSRREHIHCLSFSFLPDVAVMLKHLSLEMPGKSHDRGIAGLRLGKLRDCVMTAIVDSEALQASRSGQFPPSRAPVP